MTTMMFCNKTLQNKLQPIRFMLWRKGEMMGVTWISWDHLVTPKRLGGATILDFGNAFDGS